MSRTATAYRVVAWVVGINLILVMIGFVGQLSTDDSSWFNRNDGLISAIDIAHGWMFMLLTACVFGPAATALNYHHGAGPLAAPAPAAGARVKAAGAAKPSTPSGRSSGGFDGVATTAAAVSVVGAVPAATGASAEAAAVV